MGRRRRQSGLTNSAPPVAECASRTRHATAPPASWGSPRRSFLGASGLACLRHTPPPGVPHSAAHASRSGRRPHRLSAVGWQSGRGRQRPAGGWSWLTAAVHAREKRATVQGGNGAPVWLQRHFDRLKFATTVCNEKPPSHLTSQHQRLHPIDHNFIRMRYVKCATHKDNLQPNKHRIGSHA
jgi:hypothetical protein